MVLFAEGGSGLVLRTSGTGTRSGRGRSLALPVRRRSWPSSRRLRRAPPAAAARAPRLGGAGHRRSAARPDPGRRALAGRTGRARRARDRAPSRASSTFTTVSGRARCRPRFVHESGTAFAGRDAPVIAQRLRRGGRGTVGIRLPGAAGRRERRPTRVRPRLASGALEGESPSRCREAALAERRSGRAGTGVQPDGCAGRVGAARRHAGELIRATGSPSAERARLLRRAAAGRRLTSSSSSGG